MSYLSIYQVYPWVQRKFYPSVPSEFSSGAGGELQALWGGRLPLLPRQSPRQYDQRGHNGGGSGDPSCHSLSVISALGDRVWALSSLGLSFPVLYTEWFNQSSGSQSWLHTTITWGAFKNLHSRASLVAQWLRVCLLVQETWVRALVWEDPTCRGATGPVSHNYWACASGACSPQQERPR